MYAFWEKGVSPREFKKNQMRDIRKIMQIKSAIGQKELRVKELNDLMNKAKFQW